MPVSLKSFSSSSESRRRYLFFENFPYPSCINFVFISCLFCLIISTGLQPLQLQNLHPFGGSYTLLCALGTWQRHDFPFLEKAFMHSMQHPFFITNCVVLSLLLRSPSDSFSDTAKFWSSRSSTSLLPEFFWPSFAPNWLTKFWSAKFWSNWSSFLVAWSAFEISWIEDSNFSSIKTSPYSC